MKKTVRTGFVSGNRWKLRKYGYFIAIGTMVLVATLITLWMKRKRWW